MAEKTKKLGAIIACAVSTAKQAQQGESMADQEKINRALALRIGAEVLLVTRWSSSRRVGNRDDFEIALDFIRKNPGKVNYYIVRSIDRFTRAGTHSYEDMKGELAKYGVALIDSYEVIQPQKNALEHLGIEYPWSKSSPSEVTELVLANQSKNEVSNILIRTIGKQIELTRDGYQTGVPNDGYVNQKIYVDGKKRTIQVPDPERARFYIQMFELRAVGLYSDAQIINQLNAQGFTTKVHHKWDEGKEKIIGTRGGVLLTIKQLQRVISKPIYAGIVCEKWTGYLPVKAKYPGLVSIETFNKANGGKVFIKENTDGTLEIIKNYNPNRIKKKMKENPLFPYKFILCPLCDKQKPFVGSSPAGKSRKGFPTYHCSRKHKYIGINKKEFDNNFEGFANRLKFVPEFMDSLEASIINKYREKEKAVTLNSSDISFNIASLRSQKAMELDSLALTKNPSIRADIEDRINKINDKLALAQQERDKLEVNEADIDKFIKQARHLMEHPGKLLLNQENYQARESLFNLFVEKMPTYFDILNGTPKLSWIFELTSPNQSSENLLARRIELRFHA